MTHDHRHGRRLFRSVSRVLTFLVTAAWLVGCSYDQPQSAMNAKGPVAQMQIDVFVTSLWVILGAFIVVGGALFYTVFRFVEREGDDREPKDIHGNSALEYGFLAVSAILLIIIEIPNIKVLYQMYEAPEGSDPITVEVIGHQWWWEFRYPELGIVTANEWNIPVGRAIQLELTTADVIHSFWAPQFAGKLDTMPNQENRMWLQADEVGVFPGQCAELCGDSHALMKFETVVQTQSEFDAWVEKQKSNAQPFVHGSNRETVAKGEKLFMSKACIGCHTIKGTAAMGVLGPDLTHFGSRLSVGAGIMAATKDNIRKWVADPVSIKPGSLMPKVDLTEDEVDAVVTYLMSLK